MGDPLPANGLVRTGPSGLRNSDPAFGDRHRPAGNADLGDASAPLGDGPSDDWGASHLDALPQGQGCFPFGQRAWLFVLPGASAPVARTPAFRGQYFCGT